MAKEEEGTEACARREAGTRSFETFLSELDSAAGRMRLSLPKPTKVGSSSPRRLCINHQEPITLQSIGIIRSPFQSPEGMPIQPSGAANVRGKVELCAELAPGLKDLSGFSHIILIYAFHQSTGCKLEVTPFMDKATHGLFAARAPKRPNPVGLSIVRLISVQGSTLEIEGIDVLDGTPLLDIKPYVPAFDAPSNVRVGWLEGQHGQVRTQRSDNRFS